jgi:hypothetical protein
MTHRGLGFAAGQEVGQISPPIVYVRENVRWEYKTVEHELSAGPAIDEAELNALGARPRRPGQLLLQADGRLS